MGKPAGSRPEHDHAAEAPVVAEHLEHELARAGILVAARCVRRPVSENVIVVLDHRKIAVLVVSGLWRQVGCAKHAQNGFAVLPVRGEEAFEPATCRGEHGKLLELFFDRTHASFDEISVMVHLTSPLRDLAFRFSEQAGNTAYDRKVNSTARAPNVARRCLDPLAASRTLAELHQCRIHLRVEAYHVRHRSAPMWANEG